MCGVMEEKNGIQQKVSREKKKSINEIFRLWKEEASCFIDIIVDLIKVR